MLHGNRTNPVLQHLDGVLVRGPAHGDSVDLPGHVSLTEEERTQIEEQLIEVYLQTGKVPDGTSQPPSQRVTQAD